MLTAVINYTAPVTPSFQNCNDGPLAAGRTCVLLMDSLDDDVTFACSAVLSGSAKDVRGSVEIREITQSGLSVVAADELR